MRGRYWIPKNPLRKKSAQGYEKERDRLVSRQRGVRKRLIGNGVAGETPTPAFFVSVASKGVRLLVSLLDATLVGWIVGVAFKEVSAGLGGS
jgi:hypothetical protein